MTAPDHEADAERAIEVAIGLAVGGGAFLTGGVLVIAAGHALGVLLVAIGVACVLVARAEAIADAAWHYGELHRHQPNDTPKDCP